ncbi:MAG: 4-(cytidine 5'-diphospho)-2-C-methyl-D-erythritol kinase [Oscillospiraceae bacterium]|nr:4-(cytidine 5'-diphospho)-2-C-methyl-D-erythritol kinase [Oscillospiraceae bacterium]MCI9548982.1 4-(cytidine 5'-diphospho)-2-C-methyl-D-erythritol kinase [Oscillospiraceae bacterium]
MEISANAKINLTLDILRRREDGYHELQMVMQAVSLADQLTVVPARGPEGTASADLHFLPTGGKNLAQMAAAAFRAATGLGGQVDVTIQKRVPVCAGLAGGSADAAAVLRAMDELTGAGLSPVELAKIGEGVGSDVPFCVLGGTALAEGRGERLTPLPPLPPCHITICKPPFSISTPQLFSRVNVRKIVRRPDTAGTIAALEAGDLAGVARRMYNVFEDVLEPRRMAEIREIESALIDCGALGASMSGSGPSVFGLFQDRRQAQDACERLKKSYRDVFLCQPV